MIISSIRANLVNMSTFYYISPKDNFEIPDGRYFKNEYMMIMTLSLDKENNILTVTKLVSKQHLKVV